MHREKIGIKKHQCKTKRAKLKQWLVDGTAADIHTPTIVGIEGRTISILLDPPKSAVWVHADPSVMEYTYKVVNEERKHFFYAYTAPPRRRQGGVNHRMSYRHH